MNLKKFRLTALAPLVLGAFVAVSAQAGSDKGTATAANTDKPVFDQAFMTDAANIAAGAKLWKQCSHCHGAKAYPGKAPKLRPSRYTPEFTYKRITKGFRKMPPWKDVFNQLERMQLVAYIKSSEFSP